MVELAKIIYMAKMEKMNSMAKKEMITFTGEKIMI